MEKSLTGAVRVFSCRPDLGGAPLRVAEPLGACPSVSLDAWLYEDSQFSEVGSYKVLAWLFRKDYLLFKVADCSPG